MKLLETGGTKAGVVVKLMLNGCNDGLNVVEKIARI